MTFQTPSSASKSFSEENIEAAIFFAMEHCSDSAITYTELFAAANLESPHWYFENGFRSVITQFMEAFHYACARKELPPFDAFIVNAHGNERSGYPGTGYFSVNGLSDPLGDHIPDTKIRAAFAFRATQLDQIRTWCINQHKAE